MSASQVQFGGDTAYSNTDWSQYQKGRPPYPKQFIDLIYAYIRRNHGAQWDRIVDIGGGVGIAMTYFAKDFKTLHLSDPAPSNIENGPAFLKSWLSTNDIDARIETSQCVGEDAYKHIGEGAADLVICATAAHFMDPDKLVESTAKLLRPGGSLAVFYYWGPVFPESLAKVEEKFYLSTKKVFTLLMERGGDSVRERVYRVTANVTAGEEGLDYLPLPDAYFTNKERLRFNHKEGQTQDNLVLRDMVGIADDQRYPSRRQPNEKFTDYTDDKDPEAAGWRMELDREFLINFLATLRPGGPAISDEEFAECHAEFDKVFADECPSGKVTVVWPAWIALATRK